VAASVIDGSEKQRVALDDVTRGQARASKGAAAWREMARNHLENQRHLAAMAKNGIGAMRNIKSTRNARA